MEGEETPAERERVDAEVALEIARAERAAVIEAQKAALAKERQERDDATLAARLQGKEYEDFARDLVEDAAKEGRTLAEEEALAEAAGCGPLHLKHYHKEKLKAVALRRLKGAGVGETRGSARARTRASTRQTRTLGRRRSRRVPLDTAGHEEVSGAGEKEGAGPTGEGIRVGRCESGETDEPLQSPESDGGDAAASGGSCGGAGAAESSWRVDRTSMSAAATAQPSEDVPSATLQDTLGKAPRFPPPGCVLAATSDGLRE